VEKAARNSQMASSRSQVGFRSERGPVLISLMLSIGLIAIDSTIIATAVPSVVADLGGFSQFPWLFSVYLLAQAVCVPIYGKLADLFGRKPIMLVGIGLFLAGSVLCGFAWSMMALIVFRALQGLGAGAVTPMSMTIAADIYSIEERGKIQGYLASVWGASSVIGPTLGGVFSEYVSWRWIFFVNVPLCLLASSMLIRSFHEKMTRQRHCMDYLGASLLATGCTLLILGLLEGGEAWAWASAPGIAVLAVGAALIIAFIVVERHAKEPVLPLWVFKRRILVTSSLASLGVGATLIGLTSYVPMYVQGVIGYGPLVAGFALATLTVGWPLAASQVGKVYMRIGFRLTALIGCAVAFTGALLMLLLNISSTFWEIGTFCFVVGAGLGFVAAPTLIASQSTVGWSERGVVTGNNMFSRSLGSALGVALFGAIANAVLRTPADEHSAIMLTRASHHVFIGVVVVAGLMGMAVASMPHTPVLERTPATEPVADAA
jgi:EmrB/QacA subfamily drug resistance transporter